MARQRGKQTPPPNEPSDGASRDASGGGVPELVRRALALGFSGFFSTEETIRKALGDTLPKDWIDFAVDQSGRARQEFMERVSVEIGRSLGEVDLATVLGQLLEGRTLEVRAEIKLAPAGDQASKLDIQIASGTKR